MVGNLTNRLEKLEAAARVEQKKEPRFIRIVASDSEEAEAYRHAAETGLDTSPESEDIFVIRLIAGKWPPAASCHPDVT